jgi:hypothetical protein
MRERTEELEAIENPATAEAPIVPLVPGAAGEDYVIAWIIKMSQFLMTTATNTSISRNLMTLHL